MTRAQARDLIRFILGTAMRWVVVFLVGTCLRKAYPQMPFLAAFIVVLCMAIVYEQGSRLSCDRRPLS